MSSCISAVLKARTETGRSNLTLFFLYLPSPPTTFFLFFDSKAKLLNMDLHKVCVNINGFENIFFLTYLSYGKGQLISKENCQAVNSSKKQTNKVIFTTMRCVFGTI